MGERNICLISNDMLIFRQSEGPRVPKTDEHRSLIKCASFILFDLLPLIILVAEHNLMTVGETPFTNDPNQLAPYVLPIYKELNMVFQFQLMHIDSPHSGAGSDTEPYKNDPLVWMEWKLNEMKTIVETWQTFKRDEGYWNAYVWIRDFVWFIRMTIYIVHSIFIENHDHSRSVSRFGNDSAEWRTISAQLLAIFQITQTGTLYVYQGEEIGMKNFPRSWPIDEYKDIATINYWNLLVLFVENWFEKLTGYLG